MRQLSAKSDVHAELATAGSRLRASSRAESGLRTKLLEAEAALASAEEREQALRAALATAEQQACESGSPADAGVEARRLTEKLLVKQRDEIFSLQEQLLAGTQAAACRGGADHAEASLSERLDREVSEADALRRERGALREELQCFAARECARQEPRAAEPSDPVASESALHDLREATARERLQREAAHLVELGEANAGRQKAQAALEEAAGELSVARVHEAQAQAALRRAARAAADASAAAAERCQALREEARVLRTAAEKGVADAAGAQAVLRERAVQITVLTETVEALQGGDERDSHVASLWAQLSACRAIEGRTSRRMHELQEQLERVVEQNVRSADELSQAREAERELRAEVGALRSAEDLQSAEMLAARRHLSALQQELRQAEERLAHGERQAAMLAGRHEALEAQISAQGARHFEQRQRERGEAAAQVRALHEQLLDACEARPEPLRAADNAGRGPACAVRHEIGLLVREASAQMSALTVAEQPCIGGPPAREERQCVLATAALVAEGAAPSRDTVQRAEPPQLEVLRSLLLRHNALLGREAQRSEQLGMEAEALRRRVAVMEPALDRHITERDICAQQLLLLQRQLAERHTLQDGGLAKRLRTAEARIAALSAQLERANSTVLESDRRCAVLAAEVQELRGELRSCKRGPGSSELASTVDAALLRSEIEEEALKRDAESEARVQDFVEKRLFRAVLASAELPEQVAAAARELAAHKLSEERLADRLCVSERRQDSFKLQLVALREALQHAERQLGHQPLGSATAEAPARELEAQLEAAQADAHDARQRRQQAEARAREMELTLEEAAQLRQSMAEWQGTLQAAAERRAKGEQQALASDQQAALETLRSQLLQERSDHGRALRAAHQQASAELLAARAAWAEERASMHNALAPSQAAGLQEPDAGPRKLAEENMRLHAAVAVAKRELGAATDKLEARDATVRSLEACVQSIHGAAHDARQHVGACVPPGAGAPPAPHASAATLARQLVQAKLAEHDVRRKLRVAARAELKLRDDLAHRDQRLRELRAGDSPQASPRRATLRRGTGHGASRAPRAGACRGVPPRAGARG